MDINILKKICNKNKLNIVEFLEKEGEKSISEISRQLKIDYKNTWRYINNLEIIKVIEVKKLGQGKSTLVKLKSKNKGGV